MNLSKYKHIIWDWNGTLLNDVWLCIEIVNDLLEDHSSTRLDEPAYKEVFDFPILDYYKKVGFNFELESFELLCDKFIGSYRARIRECNLHSGVLDFLQHCSHAGLNQYVLSAAEQSLLDEMVNAFGAKDFFYQISGLSNNFAASKVENGKTMIQQQGLNPEEVIFIGDTTHDFEVAQNIGVDCILVSHGHHNTKKLKAVSSKVISSVEEISF